MTQKLGINLNNPTYQLGVIITDCAQLTTPLLGEYLGVRTLIQNTNTATVKVEVKNIRKSPDVFPVVVPPSSSPLMVAFTHIMSVSTPGTVDNIFYSITADRISLPSAEVPSP